MAKIECKKIQERQKCVFIYYKESIEYLQSNRFFQCCRENFAFGEKGFSKKCN